MIHHHLIRQVGICAFGRCSATAEALSFVLESQEYLLLSSIQKNFHTILTRPSRPGDLQGGLSALGV
jgi:hypothetical protein